MSNIKVGIKIRPLVENELKLKKEEQWISTDKNSLRCIDSLHPCEFTFDHIFDKTSLNYDVYLSIVEPVVESCMNGFNGTILTYGQTSAGKNYTMLGTDKDPGIILLAIERLFDKRDQPLKIRVSYIEIYKERIYDLFNDRKQIVIDPNEILSNDEILVENFGKAKEILLNGSYKRKSSPNDENKLSNISHAVFRIMIESEDKTGIVQKSYLKFVHVAGCEPSNDCLSDSVVMDKKSLMCLKFVVNGLSVGKRDIDFCNSTLTTLLKESLLANSNTAMICNIKLDAVEETISTLKFADQAKNIRTTPVRNGLYYDRAKFSNSTDMTPLEYRLKELADTKVVNLLLRKELEDVKANYETKTIWFEEQMKAGEFAQQKLKFALMEGKKMLATVRNDFKQKVKNLETLNQDLLARCDELQKKNLDGDRMILKQKETLKSLKAENKQLKSKNDMLLNKNKRAEEFGTGIKRKIECLQDDFTKNLKKLKNELDSKVVERQPSSSTESLNSGDTDASRTMIVSDNLIGCIIGPRGSILKSISDRAGVKVHVSNRDGNSDRLIQIFGTIDAVQMAENLIEEKIERVEQSRKKSKSK